MENKHLYDYDKDNEFDMKRSKESNRLSDENKRKKKRNKEKKKDKKIKKENRKNKFSFKKFLIIFLSVILAIIATIGTVFGVYVYKANGNISSAVIEMAADVLGEDEPIFVLILGISEDISAKLTDTIILAGYNPDSQKAFMLSIPRDTFIGNNEDTAGGYDKINAVYQKSPKKTVEAVEKLTGVKISNYVLVKNTALPAIVDAIGEIEFDVPIDMNYDDPTQNLHIHLKAGLQKINGDKAEQLLRFRHNNNGTSYPSSYGDNDFGRMRTQREFIKAIVSQVVSGNSSVNLKSIATAVFNNIETDMSLVKAVSYAPSAIKLNIEGIQMEQLPGNSEKLNELWFYKSSNSQTITLMNDLIQMLELDDQEMKKYYSQIKKVKATTKSKTSNVNTNTTNTNVSSVKNEVLNTTHEHVYVDTIISEATCTTSGEKERKCSICESKYIETIDKLGHTFVTAETISGSKKIITTTCKKCNYKDIKEEKIKETNSVIEEPIVCDKHEFETISKKEATCKAEGSEKLKCKLCNFETEKVIPKLNHFFGSPETSVSGNVKTTKKVCILCGYEDISTSQLEDIVNEVNTVKDEESNDVIN